MSANSSKNKSAVLALMLISRIYKKIGKINGLEFKSPNYNSSSFVKSCVLACSGKSYDIHKDEQRLCPQCRAISFQRHYWLKMSSFLFHKKSGRCFLNTRSLEHCLLAMNFFRVTPFCTINNYSHTVDTHAVGSFSALLRMVIGGD